MTATACTENASLISKRSTSASFQPTFAATRRTASTGVIITSFGARPLVAWPTMRTSGAMPSARAFSSDITTSAAAPSLTPGAFPAVTVPSFLNAGFSAPSASTVVSSRTGSSRSTTIGRAFLLRNGDRQDLVGEPALPGGVGGLAMAGRGVGVLLGAPDGILLGDHLARHAHVALLEAAPETVVDQRVDQLPVAHAQPFAHARQQIRRVAHRLHAAGDGNLDVAGRDALRREHHRLEPGAADLVDRQRRDVIGKPAVQRRLPRRVLAVARLDDVAHDALVDRGRIDAGAPHRLAHDQRAELRRRELLQRAEKLSGGRADGGDDD